MDSLAILGFSDISKFMGLKHIDILDNFSQPEHEGINMFCLPHYGFHYSGFTKLAVVLTEFH